MIPWAASVWVAGVALADPATDVLRQREVVDEAAATVLAARAGGSRKQEAAAMVRYRDAAAALERLEQAATPVEDVRRARRDAVTALTRALAEGERASPARDVIAAWLGEPEARTGLLETALNAAGQAPDTIRRGVLLDVVEQSDALAALLLFDAAEAELVADQLALRATSLRRHGPAQTASIADEVEAHRIDEQAREARLRNEVCLGLRERVLATRRLAIAALEQGER